MGNGEIGVDIGIDRIEGSKLKKEEDKYSKRKKNEEKYEKEMKEIEENEVYKECSWCLGRRRRESVWMRRSKIWMVEGEERLLEYRKFLRVRMIGEEWRWRCKDEIIKIDGRKEIEVGEKNSKKGEIGIGRIEKIMIEWVEIGRVCLGKGGIKRICKWRNKDKNYIGEWGRNMIIVE